MLHSTCYYHEFVKGTAIDRRLSRSLVMVAILWQIVQESLANRSLCLITRIQVYRAVVIPTLLYGAEPFGSYIAGKSYCLSAFTNAACEPSLSLNGRITSSTKMFTRGNTYRALNPFCSNYSYAGPDTWPLRIKGTGMSQACCSKEALQRPAKETIHCGWSTT